MLSLRLAGVVRGERGEFRVRRGERGAYEGNFIPPGRRILNPSLGARDFSEISFFGDLSEISFFGEFSISFLVDFDFSVTSFLGDLGFVVITCGGLSLGDFFALGGGGEGEGARVGEEIERGGVMTAEENVRRRVEGEGWGEALPDLGWSKSDLGRVICAFAASSACCEWRLKGRETEEEEKSAGDLSVFFPRGEVRGDGEELEGEGERDEGGGVEGGEGVRDNGGISERPESDL